MWAALVTGAASGIGRATCLRLVRDGKAAGRTPEDMADVIAFLLGPDARYANGHDLVVDGSVTGSFLDRFPALSQITRS